MPKYNPKPIDTQDIRLDPSLLELVEYLARNTHEVWAANRMADGWTWGSARDDLLKQHPGLVPYDELEDPEKKIDRQTAIETIKLISSLGFEIKPPASFTHPGTQTAEKPFDPNGVGLAQLIDIWHRLGPGRCHGAPAVYLGLAKRALALGESLLAHDIVKEGLRYHPSDVRLRQVHGLAQARSGAARAAGRVLEELRDDGHRDEETLGLLARCYKDIAAQESDDRASHAWIAKACDMYEAAYELNRGFWPAINVATLAACLGQRSRSEKYARIAMEGCLQRLGQHDGNLDRYWELATVAEANLLLGDDAGAEEFYRRAAHAAGGRYGNISTTLKNAKLIVRHQDNDPTARLAMLHRVLALPRVVVFSGHRIDAPGRFPARFPAEMEEAVRKEIRQALDELNCGFGYASAACGADILFLESVLDRGGEANIVLPYEIDRFCANSVARPGGNWETRFRKLLASPGVRVITTSQGPIGDGIANEYSNHFTFGLAGIRAWQLGADLAPLAVWNGQPGGGPGGTADAVARWSACGCHATIIDTNRLLASMSPATQNVEAIPRDTNMQASIEVRPESPLSTDIKPRMAAMVFTDVVNYSKLSETEIPLLIRHMLRPVAALADETGRSLLHMSTWGDAFYFVFDGVLEAGAFALDLRDRVEKTDWIALGFSRPLEIRTALHVGPVHAYVNPASGKPDFIGTHVSRAARIEPITPSGQVYASEIFAAIAFAERAEGFRCDYVGRIGLAKDYGNFPVYHVIRNSVS